MRIQSLVFLSLLGSISCSGSHRDQPIVENMGVPTAYTLASSPSSASPGQSYLLEVAVAQSGGLGPTPCTPQWVIRETNGGTITQEQNGACNNTSRVCARYTAPMTPGTFHVDIQEKYYPSVKLTIPIVVSP